MNLCSACGLDFTGVSDFDSHRLGNFPQTGPSEYITRMQEGLVDGLEPYNRKTDGRRCLDEGELTAKRWFLDYHGRWSHPRRRKPRSLDSLPRKAS